MKLKADRALGKTGLYVPPVIYGTSYLGNLYKALPYEEKLALIKKWFECNEKPVVIDTAGKYGAGLALEIIGKGMSELGIHPDDVIISNKLGWYRIPLDSDEPSFEPGAWIDIKNDAIQTFGYDEIINCYKQGNELLGKPYNTQLVSVHDPDEYLNTASGPEDRKVRMQEIIQSYKALFDLKAKGEVLAVGIGSKDWTVIQELYEQVKFDWVMIANSFTIYSHPSELISFMDLLHKDGVGIINSALFHGGYLTGGDKFDYRELDINTEAGKKISSWRKDFYSVCSAFGIVPGDACIHFGISHPAIASIALNTSQADRMSQNAEMISKEIVPEFWGVMKDFGLIDKNYSYV